MKVVCNTSPLILLAKVGRLDLLPRLYDAVLVPVAVLEEVRAKPGEELALLSSLLAHERCTVCAVDSEAALKVPGDLGAGEREAIAVGLQEPVDLVVVDDQQGRIAAERLGLRVTGTIGVLVEARTRGVLPSVRHELDRLIEQGMWVSDAFYRLIVRELGE